MLVHFVTDEPAKIPAIRAMLEPRHRVVPQLLGGGDTQISSNGVLMVDADLRKTVRVEQIRLVLQELNRISEKLFVVQNRVIDFFVTVLERSGPDGPPLKTRGHRDTFS